MDAALVASGGTGRAVDTLLQVGGNALGTGAALALSLTAAVGGYWMAVRQRDGSEGAASVRMIHILAPVAIGIAAVWWVGMLLIATDAVTHLGVRVVNATLGRVSLFAKRVEGPQMNTFARATMSEWFNHAVCIALAVVMMFLAPAVAAMTGHVADAQRADAKRKWVPVAAIAGWGAVGLGALHAFLVIT